MDKYAESYALVIFNGESYEYCLDIEGDPIIRSSYGLILEAIDDAMENYSGKEVSIVKETVQEIDTVIVPEG